MTTGFEPGSPVRIAPAVLRVVAPNPGPFTGPGTNSYLVGETELAVVDPGPAIASHVEALARAGEGRIQWILVTHTHADHSPAARLLREATGATVVGASAPGDGRHDVRFRPDLRPCDGERVLLEGCAIRCIATPGHASNHFCFLMENTGLLFTGDHVLGNVSPVILPPDGDMADYLGSLARLAELPLSQLAPGHGPVLDHPREVIESLIAHRLRREQKVLRCLSAAGAASTEALLPAVYEDVDPSLHGLALHSLHAHLIKLERDGLVSLEADAWLLKA